MVGLQRFDDLWGYAVEPLMPDRPKVRFQTKRDTGVYAVPWTSFAFGTRLLIRTPEEGLTSLKKLKLESVHY